MTQTRFCKHCSQPINGNYLTALDADWHPEHFCCAICDKPIEDGRFYIHETPHEKRPCHPTCYENSYAPRCTICNKTLTGQYQVNYWNENYCLDHAKKLATCTYCGRLVPHLTKRDRRRSVEDISCDVCASTAVNNAPQAKLLMDNLINWMEAQGLRFRQKTFRLEVLDRADFMSRQGGRRDPLGLTTSTRYMRNKRTVDHAKVESVAILKGLPHTLFEGVCVHELGHVWLVQHNIVNLPMIDEEGFCELLSHRHYHTIRSKADLFFARNVEESANPIYGDGFRKLKQLEARVGFSQIIKSLLRKKNLPL